MSVKIQYTYPFLEEGKNPPFSATDSLVNIIHLATTGDRFDKKPDEPLFGINRAFLNSKGKEVSKAQAGTLTNDVCTLWDTNPTELTRAMQMSNVQQRGTVRALRNMVRLGLMAAHEGFHQAGESIIPGLEGTEFRKNKTAKLFWFWHNWERLTVTANTLGAEVQKAKAANHVFEELEEQHDAAATEVTEWEQKAEEAGISLTKLKQGPQTWPIKVITPSPKKKRSTTPLSTPQKEINEIERELTDDGAVHRKLGYEDDTRVEVQDKLEALAVMVANMAEATQRDRAERVKRQADSEAEKVKEKELEKTRRAAEAITQRKFEETLQAQIVSLKKDLEQRTNGLGNNSRNNNNNNNNNNARGNDDNNDNNNNGGNSQKETEEKDVGDRLKSHEVQLAKKARTAAAEEQMLTMVEHDGTVDWASTKLGGMVPPEWIWRKLIKGERISFVKLITDMADGGTTRRRKTTSIDPLTNKLIVIDDDEDDEGDNDAEAKDNKLEQSTWDRALTVVLNAYSHVWPLRKEEFEKFPAMMTQLTFTFGQTVSRRYTSKWLSYAASIQRINRSRDPDGTINNPLVISWKKIDVGLRDTVCHMAKLVRCALCASPDHDTRECLTNRRDRNRDRDRDQPQTTCNHFNKGRCTYKNCKFEHSCSKCGGYHPQINCRRYGGGYENDRGGRGDQTKQKNWNFDKNPNPNNAPKPTPPPPKLTA